MRLVSRIRSALCLAALASLLSAAAATAAPGELDPSFGNGGIVKVFPSKETTAGRAVAVQADGKIVFAGSEDPGNLLVVRLLADGQFDPGFGVGGKVSTPFPGGYGEGRAVAIQPDGKIVVAGEAKGAVNGDFVFARYDSAGNLDPEFGGGDGVQIVPVGTLDDYAEAVAFGPGGSIVAVGRSDLPGGKNGAAIVVLTAGGEPDPGFAGDGSYVLTTAASGGYDQGEGVAVLADGRILVADSTAAGAGKGFVLARLLPTSAPDTSFGGDGIVETPIPMPGSMQAPGRVTDVALLADGRFVASGYSFEEVGAPPTMRGRFAAVRYLATGDPDPSFGVGGIFSTPIGLGGAAANVELAAGGRLILAGGYDAAPSNDAVGALRLDPNGSLDPSFGSGGLVLKGVTAPFGESFEDAAVDPEDRLVTLSRAYVGGGNTEVVLSRFLGDPRPAAVVKAPPANRAPRTRMKALPRRLLPADLKRFVGTASDPDGEVLRKVQIAVIKRPDRTGAKAAAAKPSSPCLVMKNAKARFKRVERVGKQCPQRWLKAKGTAKWSFELKRELAPGRYVVFARAVDARGVAEAGFSRKAGNRYGFRVLGSD